jgi:hypothetical protein
MELRRPIPHRSFHVSNLSPMVSSEVINGTLPADVESHPLKPGTVSSISPPQTVAGGPQQGGLSMGDMTEVAQQEGTSSSLLSRIFD